MQKPTRDFAGRCATWRGQVRVSAVPRRPEVRHSRCFDVGTSDSGRTAAIPAYPPDFAFCRAIAKALHREGQILAIGRPDHAHDAAMIRGERFRACAASSGLSTNTTSATCGFTTFTLRQPPSRYTPNSRPRISKRFRCMSPQPNATYRTSWRSATELSARTSRRRQTSGLMPRSTARSC